MAEEKKSIFRQKSLDRISSPEELDQYLQVTTPGTWMSMGAVIILLLGVCLWAIFGHLSTKLNVAVTSENGSVTCLIPIEQADKVKTDAKVTIAEDSYALKEAGMAPVMIDEKTDVSVRLAGNLMEGQFVYPLSVEAELADGAYQGEIIVETVSPISFILN